MMSSIRESIRKYIRIYRNRKGDMLCPICDYKVLEYLPLSKQYFVNWKRYGFSLDPTRFETLSVSAYSCPHCGASDRDRLYALYIQNYLSSKNGDEIFKVLDIAPAAAFSNWLRSKDIFDYRSADLLNPQADDQLDVMDMNIYEDCSFDFIICSHVLEHVIEDTNAMREIYRIIKPSGVGIVMVPIHLDLNSVIEDSSELNEEERWRKFGQGDHMRLYSKDGFVSRLKQVGFTVVSLTIHNFTKMIFTLHGISEGSVLYIVKKSS